MSRKKKIKTKKVLFDPIYNSEIITKLINAIMFDGEKLKAQKILYSAFDIIEKKTQNKPLEIFNEAIKNIKPNLEVRTRRVGGANYQVPVEVSEKRKITLALRWLVNHSRLRKEHTIQEKLANEIIDASKKMGATMKKKENIHKMAESNKAFAHFRW